MTNFLFAQEFKKKEFNLSEKIDGQRRIDGELVLSIEDVKEFIRLLKIYISSICEDKQDETHILSHLNELAGKKLTSH